MKFLNQIVPTAISAVSIMLLNIGCATSLAHHDANNLRDMSIDYYQDQIIDNLVRAKNGQIFLHVNVSTLNAQIVSKLSGSINGGQSLANTGSRQATRANGVLSQAVNTVTTVATRPLTFSISPERDDQITVNTSPQYGDPFVYDMYLRYLGLKKPGPLIFNAGVNEKTGADVLPDIANSDNIKSVREKKAGEKLVEGGSVTDGDLHYVPGTLHSWHGKEYYIPIAYKQSYFDLCVAILGRVVTADVRAAAVRNPTNGTKANPSEASPNAPIQIAPPRDQRTRLYIAPPEADLPSNRNVRDLKSEIQQLPQF